MVWPAMTLIFDGDYPLAYGAFELNRDPTLRLAELRAQDESGVMSNQEAFACFPEMRRGGVAVALMKITVRQLREGSILPGTRGEPLTYATARGHLAYYHALAAAGEAVVITTRSQLQQHIACWKTAADADDQAALAALPVGMIIGLESADPILAPDRAGEWWDAGVRVVSLTHYGPTRYAWGTGTTGGLTELGPPLLREMERLGMILDLTHMSDESFWEAVEVLPGSGGCQPPELPGDLPGSAAVLGRPATPGNRARRRDRRVDGHLDDPTGGKFRLEQHPFLRSARLLSPRGGYPRASGRSHRSRVPARR